ncbi:MAG: tagaturonate reductase [Sediminicola sp.]
MMKLNRKNTGNETLLPIKVVQFGEGNFLRAFVDYAFQKLNQEAGFKAGIAVVQPIDRGLVPLLKQQDGLYTLFMKGIKKGIEIQEKELITNIVKSIDPYTDPLGYLELAKETELAFIVSNTTEAGIAYDPSDLLEMRPPSSFPAKLTQLLYKRYQHFKGAKDKGVYIIPCELINHNSDTLREIMVKYISDWKLEGEFQTWLLENCSFHNTLVDRIVPGYPKDEIDSYNEQLDYSDSLIVAAEAFFLWVVEGNERLRNTLPFHKTSLDVKIVGDMQPYRTRKVRILNGAHTAMVPFSTMYGNKTVRETVMDPFTGGFIEETVFGEIIPTLDMDRQELGDFAAEVFDRFRNPFISHQLSSIALNSISKFKVRVLPSLLEYVKTYSKVPINLSFSLACLIRFYKGNWENAALPVQDDPTIVFFFAETWKLESYDAIAQGILGNKGLWDEDLNDVEGLTKAIAIALRALEDHGVEEGYARYKKQLK